MAGRKPAILPYGEYSESVAPEKFDAASPEINTLCESVYEALCDDMNTPVALAHLFDAVRLINSAKEKKSALSKADLDTLADLFDNVVFGVLGLKFEDADGGKAGKTIAGLMDMVLESRAEAKAAKDWAKSDRIRDDLKALGITVKDTKDGAEWTLE